MTQILSCLTKEFVVLVADRRLVDLRTGEAVDDEAAKVILVGSQAVVSFTGLANVKPPPRGQTDLWIVDRLSQAPDSLPAVFATLCEAANDAFSGMTHLGPCAKRHSFISVGWEARKNELEPFWLGISNAETETGQWQARAAPLFSTSRQYLQDREWHLRVTGQPLPPQIDQMLRMQLVEQEPLAAEHVLRLLTTAMRQSARVNCAVGKGMMAAILPRDTVDSNRGFSMPAPGNAAFTVGADSSHGLNDGPSCFYYPSDSNDGSLFAPHLITRDMAVADVQVHPRALSPEEIQHRYKEGLRKRA